MSLFEANCWLTLYQALDMTSVDSLPLYLDFLPVDATASAVMSNLASDTHSTVMIKARSGNIKLLHHFKHDARGPLSPKASNGSFAILGHAPGQASAIALSESPWEKTGIFNPPSFQTLAEAESAEEVRSLKPDKGTRPLSLLSGMALPPS
jgi:hypothetical protein